MSRKYYIRNLLLGALLAAIFFYVFSDRADWLMAVGMFSVASALLFPFSRLLLETTALKFTHRDFWLRGIFVDTALKSGLYALYYLFGFVFAILFALIYALTATVKGSG